VLEFLLKGLILGFTAGISPGPMLAMVIRETLQHGRRAGQLVAVAPLITDAPIIALALLVVGAMPVWAAQALGFIGGGFVIWMGIDALRIQVVRETPGAAFGSLRRAVVTNFLNTSPWLFWLPVGGPLLVDAWRQGGPLWAGMFLLGFYLLLVGNKLLLAELVTRSRRFLQGSAYHRVLQASGIVMIGLGILLIIEQL
jgi:threonine/homoserine/homoserine lactone efflux protein